VRARERAGHPASAAFQPLLDDVSARARTALGGAPFDAAVDEGGRWTTVQALDRVLDELQGNPAGGTAVASPPADRPPERLSPP
jgi:hypothetical protein